MDTNPELTNCLDRERTNYAKNLSPYIHPFMICSLLPTHKNLVCKNETLKKNVALYADNLEQCYKKYSDRS